MTSYGYDPVSRLSSLAEDLAGSTHDQSATFGYNPASQIDTLSKSNDLYAWGGHYNIDKVSAANGLNQLTATTPGSGQVSVPTITHDSKGNTSGIGSTAYAYTSENRLASAGNISLAYEPIGNQLLLTYDTGTGADTRFGHDGDRINIEIDASNWTVARRYVPGPATDETVVWYEGAGLADRRWLHADERGSVTAITDGSGNAIAINKYDEYGNPASTNIGRFGYTGQAWLPDPSTSSGGLWYYKARIYNPSLGRFMQTDPIGYADGMNWYDYVGSDPVNFTDPTGMCVQVGVGPDPRDGYRPPSPAGCPSRGGAGGSREPNSGWKGPNAVPLPPRAKKVVRPDDLPPCDDIDNALQSAGKFAVDTGSDAAKVGLLGMAGGAGIAKYSAYRLNPTGVLVGGALATGSVRVSAGAGVQVALGATVMALGGSGKEAAKEATTRALTSGIPTEFLQNAVSQISDPIIDRILNKIPDKYLNRCRAR